MKYLKIIGFRHHIHNSVDGSVQSIIMDYPQILTSQIGQSYMVIIVEPYDPNGVIVFGGKPRRLVIFEAEHPQIFRALENGEFPVIPGAIRTAVVDPYSIGDSIANTRTVAVIGNTEEEINIAVVKAINYQTQRL